MVGKDKLMSIDEVAEFLGISTKTIYRLVKKGQLSGFKVGGVWRFAEEDIEAYLERTRIQLRTPYYGRVFDKTVLTKYYQDCRKYHIVKRGSLFWLCLTDQYLRKLSPGDQTREGFKPVKYREVHLPTGEAIIAVSPGYFVRLPEAEQRYWLKFEIKQP